MTDKQKTLGRVLQDARSSFWLRNKNFETAITKLADQANEHAAQAVIDEHLKRNGEPVAWRHYHGEESGGYEYYESASCHQCEPPSSASNAQSCASRMLEAQTKCVSND